jgi:hypothetical protein
MKFTAIFTFAFAAFTLASPIEEPEAGLVKCKTTTNIVAVQSANITLLKAPAKAIAPVLPRGHAPGIAAVMAPAILLAIRRSITTDFWSKHDQKCYPLLPR